METCVKCGKEIESYEVVCPFCGLKNIHISLSQLEQEETMVLAEGGTFRMGSNDRLETEKPEHMVRITSFYINKYAVTQKEWIAIMGSNPSELDGEFLPIDNISWYDAVVFCNKRSVAEGFTPCYIINGEEVTCNWEVNGYRLPTEAEWEFAMRGGNHSQGYEFSGSNDINEVAWYADNSGWTAHPIGLKKENELGLFDMSGNIYEWCWDIYGPYTGEDKKNPKGPEEGPNRVFRGGSWSSKKDYCTVSNRYYDNAANQMFNIGLRLVRTIK